MTDHSRQDADCEKSAPACRGYHATVTGEEAPRVFWSVKRGSKAGSEGKRHTVPSCPRTAGYRPVCGSVGCRERRPGRSVPRGDGDREHRPPQSIAASSCLGTNGVKLFSERGQLSQIRWICFYFADPVSRSPKIECFPLGRVSILAAPKWTKRAWLAENGLSPELAPLKFLKLASLNSPCRLRTR
jgi:hypothetical protein